MRMFSWRNVTSWGLGPLGKQLRRGLQLCTLSQSPLPFVYQWQDCALYNQPMSKCFNKNHMCFKQVGVSDHINVTTCKNCDWKGEHCCNPHDQMGSRCDCGCWYYCNKRIDPCWCKHWVFFKSLKYCTDPENNPRGSPMSCHQNLGLNDEVILCYGLCKRSRKKLL